MKKVICLVMALMIIFSPIGALAQDEAFYSDTFKESGIIIYEANSEVTLFANNATQPYSPGSITKLLTSLVLLDNMSLDEKITATQEMLDLVEPNSSLSDIAADESLTAGQLIYAMLLPSGNDASKVAAVGCGRVILGDPAANVEDAYTAFIAAMNQKAVSLGMLSSHFTNSDGYDDPESFTTAQDILKLAIAAYENEYIREITAESQRYIETNRRTHNWYNTNMLLFDEDPDTYEENPYYEPRVKGLKTGFTDIDGRCFAMVAEDGEMVLYGVYLGMGFTSATMWEYIKKTVNIAYDSYYTLDLTKDLPDRYSYMIENDSLFSKDTVLLVPSESDNEEFRLMKTGEEPYYISFMVPNEEVCSLEMAGTATQTGMIKLNKAVKKGDVVSYMLIFDADGQTEVSRIPYVATDNVGKYNLFDFLIRVVIPVGIGIGAVYGVKKLKDYDEKIKNKNGRKTA